MSDPVIQNCAYVLAHTPSFVQYGSKPQREIAKNRELLNAITRHLRSYEAAITYPPNQVFIGNLSPNELKNIQKPWYKHPVVHGTRESKYGEIMPEMEFYGILKIADEFDLVWLDEDFIRQIREKLGQHTLFNEKDLNKLGEGYSQESIKRKIVEENSAPLFYDSILIGCFNPHHDEDENLFAKILMENLTAKASGALAVRHLLYKTKLAPEEVGYLLSCSEEAVGDRYNRGGGNLAKAIGEMCGCINATGSDVKAFCSAPIYALVHAASLVKAGVFDNVVVVGGGCLAKLGMKYQGHLKHAMPILEDILGGIAFLVQRDEGISPVIRLDSVGFHNIGASSSQQTIMESLIVKPLKKIGLRLSDVDKYATEMHNPEVTMPQGSGNVPLNNYRMIAALAVLLNEIAKKDLDNFADRIGMPGFSPTQGHIPAAVPFIGHAMDEMRAGKIKNTLFLAKGSLFLGRMSHLSDGMSFLLEKNHKVIN